MAMAITERVRSQIDGKAFRMFSVTGMVSGATKITALSLDLTFIDLAKWNPTAMTLCAISEAPGFLNVTSGESVTYTGNTDDAGTLTVIGS